MKASLMAQFRFYNSYFYNNLREKATLLAAINLRERKLDKFREISTDKLTEYMKVRLPELPQNLLDQKLNFKRSQIINGFIHASFFSMNSIFQLCECILKFQERMLSGC